MAAGDATVKATLLGTLYRRSARSKLRMLARSLTHRLSVPIENYEAEVRKEHT